MKTAYLAKYALCLLVCTCIISSPLFGFDNNLNGSPKEGVKAQADQIMQNNAVLFIENKGQVFDSENKQRNDIKFALRQKNLTTYFLPDRVSFVQTIAVEKDGKTTVQRNDLVFQNTDRNSTIIGAENSDCKYNFHSKGISTKDVAGYNKVVYKDIYPKIDVVFSVQQGNLKYDVVVHPGGDLSKFLYRYEGAKNVSLDKGDILIEFEKNKVKESLPESYITTKYEQSNDKKRTSVTYQLKNNAIGFKAPVYDKTKDLVIDPTLEWSTFVGAFSNAQTFTDVVNSADFDDEGNLYVVGFTTSFNFPVFGTLYTYLALEDAFIMKYNPTGALIWSCIFHGENNERALSVKAYPAVNRIYFCGFTDSPTMFPIFTSVQPTLAGGRDGFVACVDDNCNIIWSTYWGGRMDDVANDVYADNFVVSVTGHTYSNDFPISFPSAANLVINGNKDAFASLFTDYGLYFYSTYLNGSLSGGALGNETGNGIIHIAEGANYTMFVVGETDNQIYANTLQTMYGGGNLDGFVTRVDLDNTIPASTITWATHVGDASDDVLNDICFGQLVGTFNVVGATKSISFTDPAWSTLLYNSNKSLPLIPPPPLGTNLNADVLVIPFFVSGICPTGGGFYGDFGDDVGNDIKYGNGGLYISGTTSVLNSLGSEWCDGVPGDNYRAVNTNPFQEPFREPNPANSAFNVPQVVLSDAFLMKLDAKASRSYWVTPYKGQIPLLDDLAEEGLGVAVFTGNDVPRVALVGSTFSNSLIMRNANPFMATFNSVAGTPDGYIASFLDESKFPTFFGGETGVETVEDIARDNDGNYYIVGSTTSRTLNLLADNDPLFDPNTTTGFPTFMPTKATIGGTRPAFPFPLRQTARMFIPGDELGFVIKFDANGNRIFSAFIGFNNATITPRAPIVVHPKCVTVDNNNNVIIGGFSTAGSNLTANHTYATDVFPGGTIPSFQPAVSGATDGFLLKLNSHGERLAATFYGGPPSGGAPPVPRPNGVDVINDVTTDSQGNIIACGTTNSLINIASIPNGAYRELNRQNCLMCLLEAGRTDGFVVKFDPTLTTRAWGTYMGGSNDDGLNGITMDGYGNIAVTGFTNSAISPVTYPFVNPGIGVVNEPTPGVATSDVALSRFDPNGNVLWSKVFGAPLGINPAETNDIGMAITYNSLNDSYLVTGNTNSSEYFDTQVGFRGFPNGNTDAILIRFDVFNGQRQNTRWFGDSGDEDGDAILTIGDQVYITGGTTSNALPGIQIGNPPLGNNEAYIARFSNYCITRDHTFMGGINPDAGTGICEGWFLGYENTPVQICGFTQSGTFLPAPDPFAFQVNNNGSFVGPPQDGFSGNFCFNALGVGGVRKENNSRSKTTCYTTDDRQGNNRIIS